MMNSLSQSPCERRRIHICCCEERKKEGCGCLFIIFGNNTGLFLGFIRKEQFLYLLQAAGAVLSVSGSMKLTRQKMKQSIEVRPPAES